MSGIANLTGEPIRAGEVIMTDFGRATVPEWLANIVGQASRLPDGTYDMSCPAARAALDAERRWRQELGEAFARGEPLS